MSEVYVKDRKETSLQFYANALKFTKEIIKFVMREKVVPKKWRFTLCQDIILKCAELLDNITHANSIWPSDEEKLKERKKYQTEAICNCFQLQNKLIILEACVETVKIEKMIFLDDLKHEVDLLKAWQKSGKVLSQKDKV